MRKRSLGFGRMGAFLVAALCVVLAAAVLTVAWLGGRGRREAQSQAELRELVCRISDEVKLKEGMKLKVAAQLGQDGLEVTLSFQHDNPEPAHVDVYAGREFATVEIDSGGTRRKPDALRLPSGDGAAYFDVNGPGAVAVVGGCCVDQSPIPYAPSCTQLGLRSRMCVQSSQASTVDFLFRGARDWRSIRVRNCSVCPEGDVFVIRP